MQGFPELGWQGKKSMSQSDCQEKGRTQILGKEFYPGVRGLSILKCLLVVILPFLQVPEGAWLPGVRSSEAPREKSRQKSAILGHLGGSVS